MLAAKVNNIMKIQYKIGDATNPDGKDRKIICHICNDVGVWGAGFVVALSRRWKLPERRYREWHAGRTYDMPFELGSVQFVAVDSDTTVANMIGQHGIRRRSAGSPPIRYEAVGTALRITADYAIEHSASVHMPRIGSGLARGDWNIIEKIINDTLCNRSIKTTVYDLPKK